jgi:DNA-binding XRE family transcriptional regulator
LKLIKGGEIMKRKNLIKFRIDNGLKAKEIADRLEITKTKYSNIENGRVRPSIDFACKFQEVFKVDDVFELLKEE